jgi:quercetin dioxygenase-like cupin family protein
MKRRVAVVLVGILVAVGASVGIAAAQDPVTVGPDVYKCPFENEHTRLCEVTFKPGAKIGMHSHPEHLVYVLSPGTLRITRAGGAPQDAEFKAGGTVWLPAETHQAENIGSTEVKALVVEYKALTGKK